MSASGPAPLLPGKRIAPPEVSLQKTDRYDSSKNKVEYKGTLTIEGKNYTVTVHHKMKEGEVENLNHLDEMIKEIVQRYRVSTSEMEEGEFALSNKKFKANLDDPEGIEKAEYYDLKNSLKQRHSITKILDSTNPIHESRNSGAIRYEVITNIFKAIKESRDYSSTTSRSASSAASPAAATSSPSAAARPGNQLSDSSESSSSRDSFNSIPTAEDVSSVEDVSQAAQANPPVIERDLRSLDPEDRLDLQSGNINSSSVHTSNNIASHTTSSASAPSAASSRSSDAIERFRLVNEAAERLAKVLEKAKVDAGLENVKASAAKNGILHSKDLEEALRLNTEAQLAGEKAGDIALQARKLFNDADRRYQESEAHYLNDVDPQDQARLARTHEARRPMAEAADHVKKAEELANQAQKEARTADANFRSKQKTLSEIAQKNDKARNHLLAGLSQAQSQEQNALKALEEAKKASVETEKNLNQVRTEHPDESYLERLEQNRNLAQEQQRNAEREYDQAQVARTNLQSQLKAYDSRKAEQFKAQQVEKNRQAAQKTSPDLSDFGGFKVKSYKDYKTLSDIPSTVSFKLEEALPTDFSSPEVSKKSRTTLKIVQNEKPTAGNTSMKFMRLEEDSARASESSEDSLNSAGSDERLAEDTDNAAKAHAELNAEIERLREALAEKTHLQEKSETSQRDLLGQIDQLQSRIGENEEEITRLSNAAAKARIATPFASTSASVRPTIEERRSEFNRLVDSAQAEQDKLVQDNQRLTSENQALLDAGKTGIEKAQSQIDELNRQREEHYANLRKQFEGKPSIFDEEFKLKPSAAHPSASASDLQMQLASSQKEKEELSAQIKTLSDSLAQLRQRQRDPEVLRENLDPSSVSAQVKQQKKETKQSVISSLGADTRDTDLANESAADRETFANEISELNTELSKLNDQLKEQTDRASFLETELQATRLTSGLELENLNSRLQASESEREAQLSRLTDQNSTLEQQQEQMLQKLDELQNKLAEDETKLGALRKDIVEHQKTLSTSQAENSVLKTEKKEIEDQMLALRRAFETSQAAREQAETGLAHLRNNLGKIEKTKSDQDKVLGELQQQVEQLVKDNSALAEKNKTRDRLAEELEISLKTILEMQTQKNSDAEKFETLTASSAAADSRVRELKKELTHIEDNLKTLEKEKSRMDSNFSRMEEQLEVLKQQKEADANQLARLANQIQSDRETLGKLQVQTSAYHQTIDYLNKSLESSDRRIKDILKQRTSMQPNQEKVLPSASLPASSAGAPRLVEPSRTVSAPVSRTSKAAAPVTEAENQANIRFLREYVNNSLAQRLKQNLTALKTYQKTGKPGDFKLGVLKLDSKNFHGGLANKNRFSDAKYQDFYLEISRLNTLISRTSKETDARTPEIESLVNSILQRFTEF